MLASGLLGGRFVGREKGGFRPGHIGPVDPDRQARRPRIGFRVAFRHDPPIPSAPQRVYRELDPVDQERVVPEKWQPVTITRSGGFTPQTAPDAILDFGMIEEVEAGRRLGGPRGTRGGRGDVVLVSLGVLFRSLPDAPTG